MLPSFVTLSVYLHAEFNFKESCVAQRLQVQYLQCVLAGLIALLIYCLVSDAMYTGLLELILLLVFLRAREATRLSAVVDFFVVNNTGVTASINGQQCALSAYGLDYFSRYLALVRLTTEAGRTYRCFITPVLFGPIKFRQLLAIMKASTT